MKHIMMQYDEAAQSLIKQHFLNQSVSSEAVDVVILMLKKELEIKNKQIDKLTTALSETSKALQAEQALHAGTMQTQMISAETETFKKPKGIFARLFKRK